MAEILWVNPVRDAYFDDEARAMIDAVRAPHHVPRVRHVEGGPPHLEYHLYEHAAFAPMLELMREAQADGCGAGVIGCFYDGGLRELREALDMPVVGMAEASMYVAATLGHRFSIVVGRRKWIPKMRDNAILAGLERRVASFRSVEMGIPEMLADPVRLEDRVLEEARLAYEHDGAELVLLSEVVTPSLAERARDELPVTLLDPGATCWKWAEMAADLYLAQGLSHARAPGYEAPPATAGTA
jgi:allantoin racemase